MSKYIKVQIPTYKMDKADFYIEIWDDERKIGTLTISKSFIEWATKNKKKGYRRIDWNDFDELMKKYDNDEIEYK